MRLLVVGANGLLGSNVVTVSQDRDIDVVGTYHSTKPSFDIPLTKFDIQNTQQFDELLNHYTPDAVINCAAMTDVDACEENSEQAYAVNCDAPRALAERCAKHDVDFVHVSTDYVFDGTTASPYTEAATPSPLQVYGGSKRKGEKEVIAVNKETLITRLSFVYGIHGDTNELTGFPAWVRNRLKNGEQTPLFTDQRITPTRAGQAAKTLIELLTAKRTGLYHVACRSCITPYKFGTQIRDRLNIQEELLSEGSQDDVDRSAARPSYTCLDVSKVEESLNRLQPTLEAELNEIEDAVF
ncbi:dTDP-4-dehydrorhamnose reductase [Haladaptatus salinisoli]|uniref:dTDP-4-dehydrorhamnose reductase n=1 Tax=Haladaptatus salinisoli TaxID=2884876 RepID=UPI001D0AE924|nr:dTDP-4-dehydrorhamnose reductase [Haladaptatus salinisoli]